MRFANGSNPTFTLDELTALAKSYFASEVAESFVEDAVLDALGNMAPFLKTVHYVLVPVTCTTQCTFDLSGMDVREISNIEFMRSGTNCPGGECWRDLPWWEMKGTELLTRVLHQGTVLRIEFTEQAPVWLLGMNFPLAVAYTGADGGDLVLTMPTPVLTQEPVRVPSSGQVRLLATGITLAYTGIKISATRLTLHNTMRAGFVDRTPVISVPIAAACEFVVPLRDARLIDAMRSAVLAGHWSRMLTTCIGDEDKSFSSQMMVFYSGERDKRWKDIGNLKPKTKPRLKFRDEQMRPTVGCC